jgi:signal transduction histidine kinase
MGAMTDEELLRGRLGAIGAAHERFVRRAAHELREPLATLGVAASTLSARRAQLTPEQQDQLLADIGRSVELLRTVVDRLVDLLEADDDLWAGVPEP